MEARKLDQAAETLRKELLEKVFDKELAKLPEDLREPVKIARNTPRDKRTPEQVALFKEHPAADVQGALDLYDPEANKKVVAEQGKASALRGTKPPEPMIMGLTERPGAPPSTQLFARGDHEQPKQSVEPGELEILGGKKLESVQGLPSSGRRLAYARWLTSGRHPLVARVLVNRFWMHHFGRGLVSTLGDFGHLGERPTHPELLDWLATQFVAGEWKLKSFHRLLMTSAAYRQSSMHAESLEQDPENRYYARMKLHRLDAETLRDSILSVSGSLNSEREGPPVSIAQDGSGRVVTGQQKNNERGDPASAEPIGTAAFRRSVYVQARRTLPLTVLETFDAPVMSPNCESRNLSTVAPQSLMMLNDTFVLAQSRAFATRLQKDRPGDLKAQLHLAWWLAFQRPPSDPELKEGLLFLAEEAESIRSVIASRAPVASGSGKDSNKAPQAEVPTDSHTLALASLCQVLLAQNRFLYSD